jgi:hypothetical protein
MAPDRNERTDPETPAAMRRERPTLSDIQLDKSSLPPPANPSSMPPDATEAERIWKALATIQEGQEAIDKTQRAHASSYQADREVAVLNAKARETRERRLFWVAVIGAIGAAAATILAALH